MTKIVGKRKNKIWKVGYAIIEQTATTKRILLAKKNRGEIIAHLLFFVVIIS